MDREDDFADVPLHQCMDGGALSIQDWFRWMMKNHRVYFYKRILLRKRIGAVGEHMENWRADRLGGIEAKNKELARYIWDTFITKTGEHRDKELRARVIAAYNVYKTKYEA